MWFTKDHGKTVYAGATSAAGPLASKLADNGAVRGSDRYPQVVHTQTSSNQPDTSDEGRRDSDVASEARVSAGADGGMLDPHQHRLRNWGGMQHSAAKRHHSRLYVGFDFGTSGSGGAGCLGIEEHGLLVKQNTQDHLRRGGTGHPPGNQQQIRR